MPRGRGELAIENVTQRGQLPVRTRAQSRMIWAVARSRSGASASVQIGII